jgi:CheY-like chemotaxis protein
MSDLTQQVLNHLDPASIKAIAAQLGIDPSQAAAAIQQAVPVVVGGLAKNASTDAGANALHNAAADHAGGDIGSILGSVLGELAAASATVQSAPPAGAARNLRVVLVEDDPAQASLTAAELEARGCCVQVEDSGDRLWLTLVQQPCDAVVLDYWLRAETAAEIAVALRREPQFARIALVCYSVERDEQVLRAVLAAGCDAVVAKDDGADRLFAVASAAVTRMRRRGAPEPRS